MIALLLLVSCAPSQADTPPIPVRREQPVGPHGAYGTVITIMPDPGVVCYAWKDHYAGGLSCFQRAEE
jgi:hypothetical protein